jgi:hypothetical protein
MSRYDARIAPPSKGTAVTPHDTNNLAVSATALWVGGAGDVAVLFEDDSVAVTLAGVPAGTLIPGFIKRVLSTNTTATLIIALS